MTPQPLPLPENIPPSLEGFYVIVCFSLDQECRAKNFFLPLPSIEKESSRIRLPCQVFALHPSMSALSLASSPRHRLTWRQTCQRRFVFLFPDAKRHFTFIKASLELS
jgi:hypothetical protein